MHLASPWRIRTHTACLKNIVWIHMCVIMEHGTHSPFLKSVVQFFLHFALIFILSNKWEEDNKVKPDLYASTLRWWFCLTPNSFRITNSYYVFQNNEIPLKQVRLCFMFRGLGLPPWRVPLLKNFWPPPLKVRQNSRQKSVAPIGPNALIIFSSLLSKGLLVLILWEIAFS